MHQREKATFVGMVVGAPRPPLSLAIEVRTAGPTVTVPFEIKDVPLTARSVQVEPPGDKPAEEEHDNAE